MRTSLVVLLLLGAISHKEFGKISQVQAITEDENGPMPMRDASASKERPRLDGWDMDEETKSVIDSKKEGFNFDADVARLMDIVINSLYTKKDVFIREIISNASDALDKARFISVQKPDFLGDFSDLEIKIDFDNDAKSISITDTGVGMTKDELVKNLGTVARSGTTAFLEAMGQGESMSLIGQFGLGFYSAFLVANKVEVTSKANDDDQYVWTSTADAKFFVTKDPRGNTLKRGTRVTMYLKDEAIEYVEQEKIKNLVKKYSEFINYPIKLYLSKDVRETVEDTEAKPEESKDSETKIEDEEEKPKEEKKTKEISKTVWEWDLVNEIKAIWMRSKEEITEREYNDFYKTISKSSDDPAGYSHFSAEGEIDFKALLYLPQEAPYDMFDNYYKKSQAMKLYVRRVLIQEEFEDLMPRYLNFIKGVVDSDNLPLNVSREQLQQLKMLKVMSKKLVRKAIEMMIQLAKGEEDDEDDEEEEGEKKEEKKVVEEKKEGSNEKYLKFWNSFSKNIKLGVIEDASNRNKLAKLLRFYSTNDPEKLISFDEYIARCKPEQDTILYLPGDSKEGILKSPILKKYVKQGYEVLLMQDPIDEFTLQHLSEYEKHKIKSIAKDDVSLLDQNDEVSKKKLQKLKEIYKPLTDWWKRFLGPAVEKVTISNKLEDDPLFILTSQYGFSAQMEKVNRAQAFSNQEKTASYMLAKKTLELNPHHSITKQMLNTVKETDSDKLDDTTEDLARLMFQMALINSGFSIEEPTTLTNPLQKLINMGFGLRRDEPVTEVEIEINEEEGEDNKDVQKEEDKQVEDEQEIIIDADAVKQQNTQVIHDDL